MLSNYLKSKIFHFSLIVLLGSVFVNYYVLNVDYDVDYDWTNGGKLPPAPVVDFMFWAKRSIMMIPNHIFPPNVMIINSLLEHLTYQALRQLSILEVADKIKQNGGKTSVKELFALTNTNEESLGRILRAVSTKGIFHHHGNGVYSNNRLSSVLRKDHPNSVKNLVEMNDDGYKSAEYLDQALNYPNDWDNMDVDNSKEHELVTPWEKAFGIRAWEFYDLPENKNKRERFDKSMVSLNNLMGDGVFVDYDWGLTENSTVVDVGGGYGGVLLELLNRYKAKGIIYDLPKIVENTRKVWNEKHKEFLDRVEFFPGSFFKDPLPRADAYILRFILHDWSDTSSVRILKNLRSSVPSLETTKLIIIETLLDEPIQDSYKTQMDLAMLCFDLGKERTSQDFIKILNKSGWKYTRTVNCRGAFNIIEAIS